MKTAIAADNVNELYQALLERGKAEGIQKEILQQSINQQVVDQALLDLIIVRCLPFSIVEWPEFQAFCVALNRESPSYIPMSHNTIVTRIEKQFEEAKNII